MIESVSKNEATPSGSGELQHGEQEQQSALEYTCELAMSILLPVNVINQGEEIDINLETTKSLIADLGAVTMTFQFALFMTKKFSALPLALLAKLMKVSALMPKLDQMIGGTSVGVGGYELFMSDRSTNSPENSQMLDLAVFISGVILTLLGVKEFAKKEVAVGEQDVFDDGGLVTVPNVVFSEKHDGGGKDGSARPRGGGGISREEEYWEVKRNCVDVLTRALDDLKNVPSEMPDREMLKMTELLQEVIDLLNTKIHAGRITNKEIEIIKSINFHMTLASETLKNLGTSKDTLQKGVYLLENVRSKLSSFRSNSVAQQRQKTSKNKAPRSSVKSDLEDLRKTTVNDLRPPQAAKKRPSTAPNATRSVPYIDLSVTGQNGEIVPAYVDAASIIYNDEDRMNVLRVFLNYRSFSYNDIKKDHPDLLTEKQFKHLIRYTHFAGITRRATAKVDLTPCRVTDAGKALLESGLDEYRAKLPVVHLKATLPTPSQKSILMELHSKGSIEKRKTSKQTEIDFVESLVNGWTKLDEANGFRRYTLTDYGSELAGSIVSLDGKISLSVDQLLRNPVTLIVLVTVHNMKKNNMILNNIGGQVNIFMNYEGLAPLHVNASLNKLGEMGLISDVTRSRGRIPTMNISDEGLLVVKFYSEFLNLYRKYIGNANKELPRIVGSEWKNVIHRSPWLSRELKSQLYQSSPDDIRSNSDIRKYLLLLAEYCSVVTQRNSVFMYADYKRIYHELLDKRDFSTKIQWPSTIGKLEPTVSEGELREARNKIFGPSVSRYLTKINPEYAPFKTLQQIEIDALSSSVTKTKSFVPNESETLYMLRYPYDSAMDQRKRWGDIFSNINDSINHMVYRESPVYLGKNPLAKTPLFYVSERNKSSSYLNSILSFVSHGVDQTKQLVLAYKVRVNTRTHDRHIEGRYSGPVMIISRAIIANSQVDNLKRYTSAAKGSQILLTGKTNIKDIMSVGIQDGDSLFKKLNIEVLNTGDVVCRKKSGHIVLHQEPGNGFKWLDENTYRHISKYQRPSKGGQRYRGRSLLLDQAHHPIDLDTAI